MSTHNIDFYEEISKIITYHQIRTLSLLLKATQNWFRVITGRGSSVRSVSASQAVVPRSILGSGTFFHGKIISLFR